MTDHVLVELARDEIVTSEPTMTIHCPEEVRTEDVQRCIAVRGVDGNVVHTRRRGQFRWRPMGAIPAGRHVLVVEPLPLADGRATTSIEVPFLVVDSKAKIPERLQVEGFSRVVFTTEGVRRLPGDERPRGKFIDFIKATDRRTRRPVQLSYDQDGEPIDGAKVLAAETKRRLARTDGLPPALYHATEGAGRDDFLLADVWAEFSEGEPSAADRPLHEGEMESTRQRALEERNRCRQACEALVPHLEGIGEVVYRSALAPMVTIKIAAAKVQQLARLDAVAGVYLHDETAVMDVANSIAIARSAAVHATGETGSGVSVAVWENGPTSNDDLVIAGRYQTNPTMSDHSQNVHAIIRNNEPGSPNGHAPGCNLFSANSKDRAALTWAVEEQECTVINQSFHRSSEPGSGDLSGDDLYGDYLALHWPYPTIVHAAGNFWPTDPDDIDPPSSEYVNHKGYNTISVANHNDSATAISATSVFRNPNSTHGDRELPEIAANGTAVTADSIKKSGTSMASPAVAGVTALVQGTSSILKHWPEGCRAILTAGATTNVKGDTWWQDVQSAVDASDGTGAVNAHESRAITQNRRWHNAAGTQRGWDVGLLSSADFGADGLATFDYEVTVPNVRWGPRDVKVALCWTSRVGRLKIPWFPAFYSSNLTVDLDLKVFDSDGTQVGYSGSWDNSYEIAEFYGTPGETYTIKIRRWSGTDSTWFGIAWTVTGGMMITVPWEMFALDTIYLD
jgi:hypothetical protein